jgi:[CysO sulfur-carrier protein]-S-L-cysteine hydrolase
MMIAAELLDDVIAHARAEFDAECCGTIAYASDGADDAPTAVAVRRATNIFASPKRFEIDGKELLKTLNEFDQEGWELGAIYHSHTHTAPYPSQTDINFAAKWPGVEWVIVGLSDDEPEVRCYFIEGAVVREVALEVR